MEPITQSSGNSTKRVIFLVLILILVAMIYVVFMSSQKEGDGTQIEVTKESVTVEKIDQSSGNKVPSGFPADIPLEIGNITEANKAAYSDRGLMQYTVLYSTTKTPQEIYTTYEKYMMDSGYDFGSKGKSPETNSLYGLKDSKDLSVIAGVSQGYTVVTIVYVERDNN